MNMVNGRPPIRTKIFPSHCFLATSSQQITTSSEMMAMPRICVLFVLLLLLYSYVFVCCNFFFFFCVCSIVFAFYSSIDNIHFGKQRDRFNIDLINTSHLEFNAVLLLFAACQWHQAKILNLVICIRSSFVHSFSFWLIVIGIARNSYKYLFVFIMCSGFVRHSIFSFFS